MTRKKAIERAVAKTTKDLGYSKYVDGLTPLPTAAAKIASGYSYDEGRIAGLREAANSVWLVEEMVQLRRRADKLAKKARLK